jgi:hypothetical protein
MSNLEFPRKKQYMLQMQLLRKPKTALKRIVGPHAFVENEQRSVMCMKEEFHARFVTIL